jgi:hypothetical protein
MLNSPTVCAAPVLRRVSRLPFHCTQHQIGFFEKFLAAAADHDGLNSKESQRRGRLQHHPKPLEIHVQLPVGCNEIAIRASICSSRPGTASGCRRLSAAS